MERRRRTRGSNVPMSFSLFPLRSRCVRFGSFSAKTSRPPEILLSLSSNCDEGKGETTHFLFKSSPRITCCYRNCKTWTHGTFLSLASLGRFDTEINPTFIKLRYSRLTNSAVRPSIFPSLDLQFSNTSSCTWNTQNANNINSDTHSTTVTFHSQENVQIGPVKIDTDHSDVLIGREVLQTMSLPVSTGATPLNLLHVYYMLIVISSIS